MMHMNKSPKSGKSAVPSPGKRVTIVGLGIEGLALVRYLASQGAHVTVSDAKPAEALRENIEKVQSLGVRFSLGGNRLEDICSADVLFVSQGVPLDLPALVAARERGIPFSSVTRLFMELCPVPIVGITGSAGKSTSTSLVGEMFRAAGLPVLVGGNLGTVLLDRLDELTPQHWVVLEISHTQLELTDRSPHVAAVTNISPSHADRYPSLDGYIDLKKRIYRFQSADDWLVVNADDAVTAAMAAETPAHPVFFTLGPDLAGDGACIEADSVVVRMDGRTRPVLPVNEIPLLGVHNRANVGAACAVAAAVGLPVEAMAAAVRRFKGVAHRLEWVRRVAGVDYYDDGIATTPERTVAGLRSFEQPIVLLAGGREKHLPLEGWAREVAARCSAVVCFGEAGPLLAEALEAVWPDPARLVRVPELPQAVASAQDLARPGDIVLLSPACTSFDRYPNFEVRGRHFKELVAALEEA